ncbi:hypothetical protein LINGRAHAP2_LOCUS34448 [Linum grandiflorum]
MNSTKIGEFKQSDQVGSSNLLESGSDRALEPQREIAGWSDENLHQKSF